MKHNTVLTENINASDGKKMYDDICRKILSNKEILAWIMKGCVVEYKNFDVKDIATKYIEGIPNVGAINVATGENIQGLANEDLNGKIFYDIRYKAIVPSEDDFIELFINLEVQNNFYPGYPLTKRGIYYASNMITNQYGTVFKNSEYQKIKKVYSIWICRNAPNCRKNRIVSYDITENNIVGNVNEKKENYDLQSVVMVYLGDAQDKPESKVLKMLNTLLSEKVRAKQKIDFLTTEFQIEATEEFINEVYTMCNLSQGIEDNTIKKAINIIRDLDIDDDIIDIITEKVEEEFELSKHIILS